MTGARFSNVKKIEVQELRHALSMDMLTKRSEHLGATLQESVDEAALTESLDICVDCGPVQLFLDSVSGRFQSKMTS